MNCNLVLPFYKHACDAPSRPALWVGEAQLTYRELATLAERTASLLMQAPNLSRVGILASRSLAAYAGLLGASWAGAAYVPFSLDWPEARLMNVLETIQLDALIVDDRGLKLLSTRVLSVCPSRILAPESRTSLPLSEFHVAMGLDAFPQADVRHSPKSLEEDDLAYIIFTSGTTGTPKGVMVSAGNVARFLVAMKDRCELHPGDRVSQTYDLTFDPSVIDMFMTWGAGASLHVVPSGELMGPARFIRERELSAWFSVPSTLAFMRDLKMLTPGAFPSVRYSIFCGEPLPLSSTEAWQKAAPNSLIDNLYGPTEATVVCIGQRYSEPPTVTSERASLAIGKPFRGMDAAIVDSSRRFLQVGEKGELALSGDQVSQGYFRDAVRTAARFPIIDGRVWYLTGDLAYRDLSGTFHHLGRTDNQIKVLGNRVELEDVEAHLRDVCGTDSVAAVAWPVKDGSAQGIVAFVAATNGSVAQIKQEMKLRVPKYMVPSRVEFLEHLPLSASGKVDRRQLERLLAD